jgi:ketopantoate reductase
VIRYALIDQQPTTLGEVDGQPTAPLRALAAAFRRSNLKGAISRYMDAWLKTHAMFVTSICGAIYLADGDCQRLSNDHATLALMAQSVREGFTTLQALGVRTTPFPLRVLFSWLPRSVAVSYWSRFLRRPIADCVFGAHARHAAREMRDIANDCRDLLDQSGVKAPTLRATFDAIDRAASVTVTAR